MRGQEARETLRHRRQSRLHRLLHPALLRVRDRRGRQHQRAHGRVDRVEAELRLLRGVHDRDRLHREDRRPAGHHDCFKLEVEIYFR